MAIATSIITATRSGTPSTLIVNRGPKGADGADGADGISELGSAATTGFSAGQIPRIKTAGGVEGRTPAQVLSDIGGAAASHEHTSAQISDATPDGDLNKGKVLKTSDSGEVLVSGLTTGALAVGFVEDEGKGNIIFSSATRGRILYLPDAGGTIALTDRTDGGITSSNIIDAVATQADTNQGKLIEAGADGLLTYRHFKDYIVFVKGSDKRTTIERTNAVSTDTIYLPSNVVANRYIALTSQTDGKIKSADIDDATPDGDLNKGKVLKTSDSGEVLVSGLTTGALAVGFVEDEGKGNIIFSSATRGRILYLPDAGGTLALTNSSTGLVNVDAGYVTGTLPVANGGTGAATAPLARAALGITEYGDPVVTATSKGAAQTAIGIVNMTPAAYTALVVAGTVDATTLYLLTE